MASPQVAGMIACLLEANPAMTPAQVQTYMFNNAQSGKLNSSATTPQSYTVDATNNSSSAYTLSNGTDRNGAVSGDNDSIAIKVGDTLTITNNASVSHPMYFKTSQTTGTGDQVSTPAATGQGSYGGNGVQWTPTLPGTYYYICSNHSAMAGTITVTPDVDFDNQDSIWDGNNRYFYSPLWDDEKPWSSNISGNFGI
jgi:plastocyanin